MYTTQLHERQQGHTLLRQRWFSLEHEGAAIQTQPAGLPNKNVAIVADPDVQRYIIDLHNSTLPGEEPMSLSHIDEIIRHIRIDTPKFGVTTSPYEAGGYQLYAIDALLKEVNRLRIKVGEETTPVLDFEQPIVLGPNDGNGVNWELSGASGIRSSTLWWLGGLVVALLSIYFILR